MSWFSDRERTGGAPHWLLTLTRGGRVWRLTFSNAPVVVSSTGVGYEPAIAGRDRIERSAEVRAGIVTLRVGRTTPIADALRETRTHPFRAIVSKYHGGDVSAAPIIEAMGAVGNVRLSRGWVLFDLVLSENLFSDGFPTKLLERTCQWPAYSPESGIDERAFSYDTTITAITGAVVTVASIGLGYAGYYNAGQFRFGADASADRVFVDYHVATEFHLVDALPDAVLEAFDAYVNDGGPPVQVTLIAGDDKTLKTRRDRFGPEAVDRFSGFDLLPVTDPLQSGLNDAPIAFAPYTGADTPAPASPPSSGGLPVRTFPTLAESDTDASVTLGVDDPDGFITAVDYRTNPTGFAADWTAWDAAGFSSTPPTYLASVTKGPGGFGAIEMRVTYDDGSGPQTQVGHWEFARPFYYPVPYQDVGGTIRVDPIGFAGSGWMRSFLTVTGDRTLRVTIPYHNQKARLFIDATGGPFTLTLVTTDDFGTPFTNYSASVPVTSFDVDGYAVLEVEALANDDLDWTVIV
jgi:hypothetical protein